MNMPMPRSAGNTLRVRVLSMRRVPMANVMPPMVKCRLMFLLSEAIHYVPYQTEARRDRDAELRLAERVEGRLRSAFPGLAGTLAFLSASDRVAGALEAAHALKLAAGWAVLAVGFTALRFSGQGMLTLVSRAVADLAARTGIEFEARVRAAPPGSTIRVSGWPAEQSLKRPAADSNRNTPVA